MKIESVNGEEVKLELTWKSHCHYEQYHKTLQQDYVAWLSPSTFNNKNANSTVNERINQLLDQPIDWSVDQSINQPITQSIEQSDTKELEKIAIFFI